MQWLPARLDKPPRVVWERPLFQPGLGGLAANERVVIVSDRDATDESDIFAALDGATGKLVWTRQYDARFRLDYGNSPRATPLLHDGCAYLLGAGGQLSCVDAENGDLLWDRNLLQEYRVRESPKWGVASSPLIAGGRLIVNPGGKGAALVALDPETGDDIWKSPGGPAAYASFVLARPRGREQLIGYDRVSLGGWDPATGKRLWSLTPPLGNDFNVPSPIVTSDRLLVATENNGTRLYDFDADGKIVPQSLAVNSDLAPDSATPLVLGSRVFGVYGGLFCLDLDDGLKTRWTSDDPVFGDHATVVGHGDRGLVITKTGALVLFNARADTFVECGRCQLLADDSGVYSHPAFVGPRMYLRGSQRLLCVEFAGK